MQKTDGKDKVVEEKKQPTIQTEQNNEHNISHSELKESFDPWQIEETIAFINKHKARKIALQFPDHLLNDSTTVSLTLKKELYKHDQQVNTILNEDEVKQTNKNNDKNQNDKFEISILADTTLAPCCVDEIAAQHINAHVIIHYGWTCCSPTNRMPVLHISIQNHLSCTYIAKT